MLIPKLLQNIGNVRHISNNLYSKIKCILAEQILANKPVAKFL